MFIVWSDRPQISLLKQSLEMQLSQSQSSLQQLQHQFSQEREHLRMQLAELQKEHQRRQQRLQEVHCCSMRDMEHARQRDLKVDGLVSPHHLLWAHPFSFCLYSMPYFYLFICLEESNNSQSADELFIQTSLKFSDTSVSQ